VKLGLALVRIIVGALFVGHGTQKLFGWFGGHGPDGTGQFFESLGLKPGRDHALRAGAAEAGGGALLAAGLLTPVGATLIISVMTSAIRTVHAPNGPWVSEGGYEYNLTLIALMVALAELGPGDLSLDRRLGIDASGLLTALAVAGAGVAGSFLTVQPAQGEPSAAPAGDPASTA
jgi:putative oxidoreductase